jgi:hypothetical protein
MGPQQGAFRVYFSLSDSPPSGWMQFISNFRPRYSPLFRIALRTRSRFTREQFQPHFHVAIMISVPVTRCIERGGSIRNGRCQSRGFLAGWAILEFEVPAQSHPEFKLRLVSFNYPSRMPGVSEARDTLRPGFR